MAVQGLFLDVKPKTPAAARRARMAWTQRIRHLVQFAFAAFILYTSVIHNAGGVEDGSTAGIDSLCPFGAVETAWRYITQGQFIQHIHVSSLILGLGLLIGVVLAGGAFCGWVCPFGAVMDLLTWIRAKLRIKPVQVPERLDGILRYGRFVILALVLYETISTITLWFANIDPYRTLFGLEWLFAFNAATNWIAYTTTVVILLASLFVERAWCRYACPVGGLISFVGNASLLRIRRDGESCKGCNVCEVPCPVKLKVATANTISPNCIGCLACVDACPRHGALEVKLAPTWLDRIRGVFTPKILEGSNAR